LVIALFLEKMWPPRCMNPSSPDLSLWAFKR